MNKQDQINAISRVILDVQDKIEVEESTKKAFTIYLLASHRRAIATAIVSSLGIDEEQINKCLDKMYAECVGDASEFSTDRKIAKALNPSIITCEESHDQTY